MPRPFRIKTEPPPPLTLEQVAEKYGVPREKSRIVKAFVAGIVSASESSRPIRLKAPRNERLALGKGRIAASASFPGTSRGAYGAKGSGSKRSVVKAGGAKTSNASRRGSSRKKK